MGEHARWRCRRGASAGSGGAIADKLEGTAQAIREAGGETFVLEMDVANSDSIASAIGKASKEFGRIDILVNNAGVTKDGLAVTDEAARLGIRYSERTSAAPFYAIQEVLQAMMRERWGRIVNISSVVGEKRQSGTGELRGVEGGADWVNQIVGAGSGQPQYHRECGGAGLYRHRYDARTAGRFEAEDD